MVDLQKALRLISSWDHCQRFSPLQISNTPREGFEPAQNPNYEFFDGSCAEVLASTARRFSKDASQGLHHNRIFVNFAKFFRTILKNTYERLLPTGVSCPECFLS